MVGESLKAQARRIITGVDANGRSTFIEDGNTPNRIVSPGFTLCDIWHVAHLPVHVNDDDFLTDDLLMDPAPEGFVYRILVFPPDSEWDAAAGYADSMQAIGANRETVDSQSEIPGIHQTETVDIITIISGEIYAVSETGEVLMRPGDSIVQRGTKHTWNNRTNEPCTTIAVLMPARR